MMGEAGYSVSCQLSAFSKRKGMKEQRFRRMEILSKFLTDDMETGALVTW